MNSTRTMNSTSRPAKKRQRSGTLMACVLVCMLVVGSMIALIARDAVAARRETKLRLQMMQTERLLDAGILRSAGQLNNDPSYEGESWNPTLQFADRSANATVDIEVRESQVSVTARIGHEPNITTKSYTYQVSFDQ